MTAQFDLDVLIVGAGVVGLAIGRALAEAGRDVTVVDRNMAFGMETSSRNSEVIHAGLYYPPGSLKAQFCVEGRQALYRYCEERHIPHRRCGKLIVANGDSGTAALQAIQERAGLCGVSDLEMVPQNKLRELEPQVSATFALLSPSTGIIDSHALMQAYLGDIEDHSGRLVLNTEVSRIEIDPSGGFRVAIAGEDVMLTVRTLINSGGLWADDLARRIEGLPETGIPTLQFARGVYFSLSGVKPPFSHLIYPLPDNASLGVHATLDMGGAVRFGPDVEWITDRADYTVDPTRSATFAEAIRSYWPEVREEWLIPAYAGIRPKLCGPGDAPADFRIDGPEVHGVDNLICLYGIESPGLTSSLVIGAEVARRAAAMA